ncbi:MAG: hypothetical protein KJN76_12410 [Eudoraea sp.]|nr:hypothetical protein [Eudoraea sp.]
MKRIHVLLVILMATAVFVACKKEKDPSFLITKDNVGKLNRSDKAQDIDRIFVQDSIVQDTILAGIGNNSKKIEIYEKGGKHLLTITPSSDSIPGIENVRIYDPRFVSEKGVGITSTFKDIKDNYTIKKIVTSRNNVVLFVKESDMYFTISKEELPASLRYAASTNIEAVQIPDKARIKYLMVGWE